MKKGLLVGLLILIIFLVGCEQVGKAGLLPGELFAVERSVSGNLVTLALSKGVLDPSEIVIIADRVPEGVMIVPDGWSIPPTFNDDSIIVWLFAENPPQTIGSLTIDEAIPASITYEISGVAVAGASFRGKWGLKVVDEEGLFAGDEVECVVDDDCDAGEQCIGGVCTEGVTIIDLLNALTQYKNGEIGILDLLAMVEAYKQNR